MRNMNNICALRNSFQKILSQTNLSHRILSAIRSFSEEAVLEKNTVTKKDTSYFPAKYVPKETECEWYEWWESMGYFDPNPKKKKTFSIILPPPNVTGSLHLGHALTATIQDVLARWHRMRGESVVWVPGLDHAGIATHVMVEKKLWKEKQLTRHDLGQEKFMEEVWKWKEEKAEHIIQQLRNLGVSLTWSREFFTLDPKHSDAVTEAFIHLFDVGLLYRADALVNWSCLLQSAISDIEVEHRHFSGSTMCHVPGCDEPVEFGVLTDFAYKLCNTDAEVVVSTTRIETMLGDVAIAVNPNDLRYKGLQGAKALHPFTQRELPIIFDEFVDPKFGTGAVKITPAHDATDLEVAKRHDLEAISVFTAEGKLNEQCGPFVNLDRLKAKIVITAELEKLGLLRGKRDHETDVPFCSRSGDVVEFMLKPQWFIKCKEMADDAAAAVQNSILTIEPDIFDKDWYRWLYTIKDWCVSRQVWWGHRIPAYECVLQDSSTWVAASSADHARRKLAAQLHLTEEEAQAAVITQDKDVLDTWFSSALIPFTAFGWPDQGRDYQKFYPLTMMETGYDILFFWVARMVMLGSQLTCKLPFNKIVLHGVLTDAYGRKMSKSLGNVVLPEDVIHGRSQEELHAQVRANFEAGILSSAEMEKAIEGQKKLFPKGIPDCGIDGLRFTLASSDIKDHEIKFNIVECHSNRLFCNKVWQATKYLLMCLDKFPDALQNRLEISKEGLRMFDRWILNRLSFMVTEVDRFLMNSDVHLAARAVKTFFYEEFCNIYLESSKPPLKDFENQSSVAICRILLLCVDTTLHCLSLFMPFLAEELFQRIPVHRDADSIMVSKFPVPDEFKIWRDPTVEKDAQFVMDVVTTVRRLKLLCKAPKGKPTAYVTSKIKWEKHLCEENADVIKLISGCEDIITLEDKPANTGENVIAVTVTKTCSLFLFLKGEVNVEREEAVINKKLLKLKQTLARFMEKTSKENYEERVSEEVKRRDAATILEIQEELRELKQLRNLLSSRFDTTLQD